MLIRVAVLDIPVVLWLVKVLLTSGRRHPAASKGRRDSGYVRRH